jgi:hypothetical protein
VVPPLQSVDGNHSETPVSQQLELQNEIATRKRRPYLGVIPLDSSMHLVITAKYVMADRDHVVKRARRCKETKKTTINASENMMARWWRSRNVLAVFMTSLR